MITIRVIKDGKEVFLDHDSVMVQFYTGVFDSATVVTVGEMTVKVCSPLVYAIIKAEVERTGFGTDLLAKWDSEITTEHQ